jgi:SAM-dependent MidA family methyltransferase
LTSPALGSVFARLLGNAIDAWWEELGCPRYFDFVECGAGDGTLAEAVLELDLRCRRSLRYTAVEQSEAVRRQLLSRLADVRVVDAVPSVETGVIFANELLDNLPVRLFQKGEPSWLEVLVDLDGEEELCEYLAPVTSPPVPGRFPSDARIPLQTRATRWFTNAVSRVGRGRVVCVDYARTTQEMAALSQEQWLRTYREHRPGTHPLRMPGRQDITCDVAVDQLVAADEAIEIHSQREFLAWCGSDELRREIEAAMQQPGEGVGLAFLKAQAQRQELLALVDPAGMGGFQVFQRRVCAN